MTREHPDLCPKCGHNEPFEGPKFMTAEVTKTLGGTKEIEFLQYTCARCGWVISTPCLDARKR